MAIEVKHATESVAGPYTPEGELGPAEWNELHDLAGDAETLLYFDAEGDPTGVELDEEFFDIEEGVLTFVGETGGDPIPGQWVEVSRAVADNDAVIDFTGIDDSADEWRVKIYGAAPASGAPSLYMRSSSNGGSSYDAGNDPHDYKYSIIERRSAGFGSATDADSGFIVTGYHDGTDVITNSTVTIFRPSVSHRVHFQAIGGYERSSNPVLYDAYGYRDAVSIVNAVRFFYSAVNIVSGIFVLERKVKP